MWAYIIAVVLLVVTSVPQSGNSQSNTGPGSTSKIISFKKESYIRYTFQDLSAEMVARSDKESISVQFTTKEPTGIFWVWKDKRGQEFKIGLQSGQLMYELDTGRGTPSRRVLRTNNNLNDFYWHTVQVDRDQNSLQFSVDGQRVGSPIPLDTDIQFVNSNAEVFLGGQPLTAGSQDENFDGALTEVQTKKEYSAQRQIVIEYLQYIGDIQGNIDIIGPGEWEEYLRRTTRPPPTTAAPLPSPVTFKTGNTAFYLGEAIDMRTGGNMHFRFRTQEPRGLLCLAQGGAQSPIFFAFEVFDGQLYFVYDFGSVTHRKPIFNKRVDDGEWHDVKMTVQNNVLTLSLDDQPLPVSLSANDKSRMYFYRIYFGGYSDYTRTPWHIYSRRGYKGCLESLSVQDISYDLQYHVSNKQGVEAGCRTSARFCQTQPCVTGFCTDRMDGYKCSCADTPNTGRNCDLTAPIGGWNDTFATIFTFVNREMTHTNDISFRFNTPLSNTILFRTEADNRDDFIMAELVEGQAKVTVKVDGQTKIFSTGNNLNDYSWHTLYFKRRADNVEVWVDNEPKMAGVIPAEDFQLFIDRIKFGSFQPNGNYIGYLQNFIYEDQELFGTLKDQSNNHIWLVTRPITDLPWPTYNPVTISSSDAFFQLESMHSGLTMKIMFKFKTRESDGLILYNAGTGNDVIAIELQNGKLRLAFNLGGSNMFAIVPTLYMLNDNQWHTVLVALNENGQFSVQVDRENLDVSTSDGDRRLSLSGSLYIAGFPSSMFNSQRVTSLISSRTGFRGCLASMDLNGFVPDLINYGRGNSNIMAGCTDLVLSCKENVCGAGTCVPMIDGYWCNCNTTGRIGAQCAAEPTGYYFGKHGNNGMLVYEFPYDQQFTSEMDTIAFGFMTEQENGVLYRLESAVENKDFIEIRMENGYIVAESNTGGGLVTNRVDTQRFNDGNYHVVKYIRTIGNSSLQVNSLPINVVQHTGQATMFDRVYRVVIGGRMNAQGTATQQFHGIIGGVYYNNYRWLDYLARLERVYNKRVEIRGDVVLVKPFLLVKGGGPTTAAPPDIVIPNEAIPDNIGGGGIIGTPIGGVGDGKVPLVGIGEPGTKVLITGFGIDVDAVPAAQAAIVGPPAGGGGARAGAVVGTVLGTLGFLSSLMWALYKLKPGVPTVLSPGPGDAKMAISSPRAASNLPIVQAASAPPKPAAVNGTGGGGGSSTYTSYFQSTQTAVGGGGGASASGAGMAMEEVDSSTLRATGTFSNKGTAIGSPTSTRRSNMASSSSYSANYQSSGANYQSNNANYQSSGYQSNTMNSNNMNTLNSNNMNTMQSYGSGGGSMGGGTMERSYDRQYMSSASGGDNIPDYDMPMPGTMQSGQSYSSTTLNTNYNYQVSNFKTVTVNKQGQYMMTTAGGSGGAVTPGAAADEVRVDCCLMTGDGRNVVTGSSLGPPQVWDMQTGELQNIMKGDTIGSTDLHLVCGDRLLVGAVHADMEINEYSSRKGVYNHTLQIWDFMTGRPLAMAEGEYCSALCPMSDSDKVLFGKTDKFGDATSIIAWDLMGNQMIKEMRYDAPVGNNDYISYLNKSKNDRYIIAGYTNSFDNNAEFMTFDMTLTSYNISEPAVLKLDANPDVTAVLPKDEAVTGLRNGDLVIWNIRTAQPSRQLLGSGGAHAHNKEVKCLSLSEDSRYLVSGSADGTLKVWDMHTERPIHTLQGHSDEVWCTAISSDNEIVVSGSADGTIRLWRMKNGTEMCVFNCGVDIFNVNMSHDKGTIVALGDKFGARKLIMLQVVRTKIKKIVSS